ncbi:MAG: hypothetical protein R2761_29965 [Acidimicrobiales bacterium]
MIPRRKLTVGAIQIGAAVALFAGVAGAAVTTGQVLGIGSGGEVKTQSADDNSNGSTSTTFDDKGGLRPDGASDDGPNHDLNDDKGGLRPDGVSDDGPNHDVNDDKGGDRSRGGHGSDDGPNHDVNDDKGGDRSHGGHGSDD